jgi:hypothetical protein
MSTHRTSWKRRERNAAAIFGAKRKPLSGSCGRDDETRSDSTHPTLFIETKLRAASAARSLWEQTRDLARREGKTPVLTLYSKGKPGALIVVHEDDLAVVAAELAAGRDKTDGRKENGGDLNPAASDRSV